MLDPVTVWPVSLLRTYTTGLYNTWKSTEDIKSLKLFLGEKWYLRLPDEDQLCLLINYPKNTPKKDLYIVIHGLAGAATDPSVVNVTEKFLAEGHIVVRMNLRGSGHGAGLARNIYHAGRDEDLITVVAEVQKRFPDQDINMIGMSLSSNMMFRYLAKNLSNPVKRAVALSPVIDLKVASKKLSHAYFGMINKSVMTMLKSYFVKRKRAYADTSVPDWKKIKRLHQFDDLYIAPEFGFANAAEYYESTSSLSLIPKITTPWKAVVSLDDPIAVSEKKIFRKKFAKNTVFLKSGGHLYLKKHGGLGAVAYKTFQEM